MEPVLLEIYYSLREQYCGAAVVKLEYVYWRKKHLKTVGSGRNGEVSGIVQLSQILSDISVKIFIIQT